MAVDADSAVAVVGETSDSGGRNARIESGGHGFAAYADAGGAVGAAPDSVGEAAGGAGLAEDGADGAGGFGEGFQCIAGAVLLNVDDLGGVGRGKVSGALLSCAGYCPR